MVGSMQYLRMFTNALMAGALLGAYVVLLVLQLNPMVQLTSGASARLTLTWWAFYCVHATALFYGLIVVRQMLAMEVRTPAWLSLRMIAPFGAVGAALSALIMWLNLDGFRTVLGPEASSRMTTAVIVVSVCAAVCIALAGLQLRLRHGRRLAGACFTIVLAASLAGPLLLRGIGDSTPPPRTPVAALLTPPPSGARVHMILFDGASLDFIAPNAAGGRLVNFARLMEGGAVMHLATLRPTQPASVWTAVATGKLPYRTSVYSAARYIVPGSQQHLDLLPDYCFAQALVRFGFIEEQPRASDAVRAHPVWELLSRYGISAGVIHWPLTYPAHGVNGYLISDEFLHRDPSSASASLQDESLAYPPQAVDEAQRARMRALTGQSSVVFAAEGDAGSQQRNGGAMPTKALTADMAAEYLSHAFGTARPVQFKAVRYAGVDAVGHYYMRYAVPRAFGDVSDEERARHGRVLERYYIYLDGIVGRAMESLAEDDLLFVVSGFGMEPLSLGKRLLERFAGDPDLSGSHERAPDGFAIAYGRHVANGNYPRASVVDIVPTILYYYGLPIARDLDGFARTDIFRKGFTEGRPITFIPYYER
jgi:predicted AlkP superfamily phosphohydrolase/phosphomutase